MAPRHRQPNGRPDRSPTHSKSDHPRYDGKQSPTDRVDDAVLKLLADT